MEKSPVNINMAEMGKAIKAYVRTRAIRSGSFVVYLENNVIIKEDPRTGQKTIIPTSPKK
jgi:hypothetical protein